MDSLEPLETRVNLGLLEFQAPGGSQELWARKAPQGLMAWGYQGQQECQGHRAQLVPKASQGPGAPLA